MTEIKAGGVAAMWAAAGHHVKFVSPTNGDIGHWARRRQTASPAAAAEVQAAAKVLGIETEVPTSMTANPCPRSKTAAPSPASSASGRPTSSWPRTNDYHPDHRYTGILVQDAAYMVTVPFFCPDVPHLKRNPVFLYYSDNFQKPNPFDPDVVISIDSVLEKKTEALSLLDSQFVEGGCGGNESMVPRDDAQLQEARRRVKERFRQRFAATADKYRDDLIALYGEKAGKASSARSLRVCEYGRRPSPQELKKLFLLPAD